MKPIVSPHDNFPRPTAWTRTTAIEAFGVTYLHDTSKGAPIREVLGSREPPLPTPGSVVTAHGSDGAAIAYANSIARAEAEREIADIDTHLDGKVNRLKLGLARNSLFARNKLTGLLATESIMDRRRRECLDIVENGVRTQVRRLPESLRMPIVLPINLALYVVDMRDFPLREVQLTEARIQSHSFVEVEGHPAFDVLVRYHVEGMQGAFSYDHPALLHKTLESTPDGVRVFLLKAAALDHITEFSTLIQDRLVQGLAPVVSIAPRSLPSPTAAERTEREAEVIPFPPQVPSTPSPDEVEAAFTETGDVAPLVAVPLLPPAPAAVEAPEPVEEARETPPEVPTDPPPAAMETPVAVEDAFLVIPEPTPDELPPSLVAQPAIRLAAAPKPVRQPSILARVMGRLSRPSRRPPSDQAESTVASRTQPERDLVREALEFAASDEMPRLPVAVEVSTPDRSEIEGFLRRGGILLTRPDRQPESESLALAMIQEVAPDLLEGETDEETMAA